MYLLNMEMHAPKMKTLHFYNGIYDAWKNNNIKIPHNASGI